MRRALLLAAGLLAASPAGALTCARPDPLRSLRDAQAAPERYAVLLGRLAFDAGAMPESGYAGGSGGASPGPAPVPARFAGRSLGPDGFVPTDLAALTLRPTCAGPWCGTMAPGGEWLLLARETPTGWEVEVGPCGGMAFESPAPEALDRLAACLRDAAACGP